MKLSEDQKKLLSYYLGILRSRDYSVAELVYKAVKKGYQQSDIEIVVDKLIDLGYVDDARLAENIIRKYSGQKGVYWIKQKMLFRKIPKQVVDNSLSGVQKQPSEALKAKIERKYKIINWISIENQTKSKIYAYLSSRGFADAYNIINKWSQE